MLLKIIHLIQYIISIESEMEDDDTSKRETIPDEQKATLRQEFLTIMQERFMFGQDIHFNYR